MSFKDKVVVVTGAATGIGAATARLFGEKGAAVVLVDLKREHGEASTKAVQATGAKAIFVEADVTREDSVKAIADQALKTFGRIDILINNAAILLRHATLEEWPLAEVRRILDVNLASLFITTHTIGPVMAKTGGGTIINISSLGALMPVTHCPPYGAAKAGILGLTRSIAPVLAPLKIRVNAVLPGLVDTPMTENSPTRSLSVEGIMQPEDLAKGIVYVAGSDARSGAFFLVQNTPKGPRLFDVADMPAITECAQSPFQ